VKVLIAHNRYQQRSGEDAVVDIEYDLLKAAGVDAVLRDVDNDAIKSLGSKLTSAAMVAYSPWGRRWMRDQIADVRPDIVHVHNHFPRLSPSIYDACRDAGVPVVHTLHNFRISCAAGTFVREGRACEQCLTGSPYQAVGYRCYRGSTLGSLALATMIDHHRRAGTYARKVDRFIALTEFARSKYIAAGVPADRIIVKPNTAPDPGPADPTKPRHGGLYVGRLSPEKGVAHLVEAWRGLDYPLRVVGTGPIAADLAAHAPSTITFLGSIDRAEVRAEMAQAAFLIVPSTCYEGFPMVIAEAYACGLPVLASRIGSLAEVVVPGVTGQVFEPEDSASLATMLRQTIANPEQLTRLGNGARMIYDRHYSGTVVLEQLLEIYRQVVNEHRLRTRDH
jgi:glycosyltransferase involved in cell wall biosynthesis